MLPVDRTEIMKQRMGTGLGFYRLAKETLELFPSSDSVFITVHPRKRRLVYFHSRKMYRLCWLDDSSTPTVLRHKFTAVLHPLGQRLAKCPLQCTLRPKYDHRGL